MLSTTSLLEALRHLGLLTADQLKEAERLAPSQRGGAELGRELAKRQWLTAYQAEELSEGRGPALLVGSYVLLDRLGPAGCA
jgi:hypothetical protein